MYCVSAVLGFIGIIIFGVKFGEDNSMDGTNLHVSFYLALFAGVVASVAAIFYIVAKPKAYVHDMYN